MQHVHFDPAGNAAEGGGQPDVDRRRMEEVPEPDPPRVDAVRRQDAAGDFQIGRGRFEHLSRDAVAPADGPEKPHGPGQQFPGVVEFPRGNGPPDGAAAHGLARDDQFFARGKADPVRLGERGDDGFVPGPEVTESPAAADADAGEMEFRGAPEPLQKVERLHGREFLIEFDDADEFRAGIPEQSAALLHGEQQTRRIVRTQDLPGMGVERHRRRNGVTADRHVAQFAYDLPVAEMDAVEDPQPEDEGNASSGEGHVEFYQGCHDCNFRLSAVYYMQMPPLLFKIHSNGISVKRKRNILVRVMKTVLYPGSFDPFTNGHYDLVCRAVQLFDKVIVAVAVNAGKSPMFTLAERRHLIEQCCADLPTVEVVVIEGLLVDSLERYGVQAILRGLRAFSDFEYELQMALMNRNMRPQCETIFLTPTLKNSFVSSSLVKEVASYGGDVRRYVPDPVAEAIIRKNRGEDI